MSVEVVLPPVDVLLQRENLQLNTQKNVKDAQLAHTKDNKAREAAVQFEQFFLKHQLSKFMSASVTTPTQGMSETLWQKKLIDAIVDEAAVGKDEMGHIAQSIYKKISKGTEVEVGKLYDSKK